MRITAVLSEICSDMPQWSQWLDKVSQTEYWKPSLSVDVEAHGVHEACVDPWYCTLVAVLLRIFDFLDIIARGMAQVVFCNNPISGLCIIAALFTQNSFVGKCCASNRMSTRKLLEPSWDAL